MITSRQHCLIICESVQIIKSKLWENMKMRKKNEPALMISSLSAS